MLCIVCLLCFFYYSTLLMLLGFLLSTLGFLHGLCVKRQYGTFIKQTVRWCTMHTEISSSISIPDLCGLV